MSPPASTGSGEPVFETDRSAAVRTSVVANAELFDSVSGSGLADCADTTFVIGSAAAGSTCTMSVKLAVLPAGMDATLHLAERSWADGVLQVIVGPLVCVRLTGVTSGGMLSCHDTSTPSDGPRLL